MLQHDNSDRRRTRSSQRRTFLIGKHVAGDRAAYGRATRGWVAYNLDDNVMVFLKEQWRSNSPDQNPEMATYSRLREHDVRCVATVIAGGDVGGPHASARHETISQEFFEGADRSCYERIHTRIVFKEVGRPLGTYVNSIELMTVVTHAIIGKRECFYIFCVSLSLVQATSKPGKRRAFCTGT